MTQVDIANLALNLCGAEGVLVDLNDKTKEGRLCAQNYDNSRKTVLSKHPWKFAITRVQVDQDTSQVPAFEFVCAYPMPDDYLRMVSVNDSDTQWIREGQFILTNESTPLNLRYVADNLDVATYDPQFCDAFAAEIAKRIVFSLTQSNEREQFINKEYEMIIRKAKHANAIERSTTAWVADLFDNARMGPNRGFVRDPMT